MEILVYSGLELIGDGVMKLPFLAALRERWPTARITWLAGKGKTVFAGVLAPLARSYFDEVIEDAGVGLRLSEVLRRPLPGRSFDLVIDTQRRVPTTLVLRRIRARSFVSGAADFWLSDRRPPRGYRRPQSMLGQMLDLIEIAGGRKVEPRFQPVLDEAWTAPAAMALPLGPRYVGLAPGAGNRDKCWPRDRFVEFARVQLREGRTPVFVLGPDEATWRPALAAEVPGALFPCQDERVPEELRCSPLFTIAVGQRLSAAVANDSGTGHLLAAAVCPLVSLFGPTRPEKFAPATPRLEIVRAQSFGGDGVSLIPVVAVVDALERLLGAPAISAPAAVWRPPAQVARSVGL